MKRAKALTADNRDNWDGVYEWFLDYASPRRIAALAQSWQERTNALDDIVDYNGGAPCACKDEYVMDRARAALGQGEG